MEEKSVRILKPQTNKRTYAYCCEHFVIKKKKKSQRASVLDYLYKWDRALLF